MQTNLSQKWKSCCISSRRPQKRRANPDQSPLLLRLNKSPARHSWGTKRKGADVPFGNRVRPTGSRIIHCSTWPDQGGPSGASRVVGAASNGGRFLLHLD